MDRCKKSKPHRAAISYIVSNNLEQLPSTQIPLIALTATNLDTTADLTFSIVPKDAVLLIMYTHSALSAVDC